MVMDRIFQHIYIYMFSSDKTLGQYICLFCLSRDEDSEIKDGSHLPEVDDKFYP